MIYQIRNLKTKEVYASRAIEAKSFVLRLKGLMGMKSWHKDEMDGLILNPCNSIHTFFMRIEIDVLFLDKNNKLVHSILCMKPWRVSPFFFSSSKVIELPKNSIKDELNKGDLIEVLCIN